MSTIEIVGIILGALAAIGLVVGFVHAQGLTVVRNDLSAAKSEIMNLLHAVHTTANAPVTVAVVPSTSSAPAAPSPAAATPHADPALAPAQLQPWQLPALVYDAAKDGPFADFRAKNGAFRRYVSPRGIEIDVRGDEIGAAQPADVHGNALTDFVTPVTVQMIAAKPTDVSITMPDDSGGFAFRLMSCVGQTASAAQVTMKDAAGNVVFGPTLANPNQWASQAVPAAKGAIFTASVGVDKDGPLRCQLMKV